MAEAINNGGPAFPVLEEDGRGNLALTSTGVTKRDFFAAKAMGSMICMANEQSALEWHDFDMLATSAYAQADAMLKAREA